MILVKTKNTIRCIFERSNIQYMEWIFIGVHGTLKIETGKLAFVLLYC
jgi:hypothetical protein